jgi:hypothetical protein
MPTDNDFVQEDPEPEREVKGSQLPVQFQCMTGDAEASQPQEPPLLAPHLQPSTWPVGSLEVVHTLAADQEEHGTSASQPEAMVS